MVEPSIIATPENPLFYRAVGIVKGQYVPSTYKFRRGIFVTSDEENFPGMIVTNRISKLLLDNPEILNSQHIWSCYPRIKNGEIGLEFDLLQLYRNPEKLEKVKSRVDYFTISGEVQSVNESSVTVTIKRNMAPPPGQEHWQIWKPFTLTLQGQLPELDAVGKFWEFDCMRSGSLLLIESASLKGEPPQVPLLSNAVSPAAHDTTKTQPPIPKKAPKAPNTTQPTFHTGDDMAISGKLEITIKINSFPDEIRTTQNGGKSFEVDCDGQMVSITVKPKMFKKLEDAQVNWPLWVAAIGGKLGARTANGFILEQPTIQTFERKPKSELAPAT